MQLELTEEEAVALGQVLSTCLRDLPSEIRHTDNRQFRSDLRDRREALQRIRERLEATKAA
jgi:hypothetical protein